MSIKQLKQQLKNRVSSLHKNKRNSSTQSQPQHPNRSNNPPLNQHSNQQSSIPNFTQPNSKNQANNLIVPDEYNQYKQKYNEEHAKKGFFGRLIQRFKNAGTSKQIDTSGVNKFKTSMISELGYKGLTPDHNHFLILSNNYRATRGYAEILQIGGASLDNLPPNLSQNILRDFINFLRAYTPDMTFISIHLPNDSKPQQFFWAGKKREINYKILSGQLSPHHKDVLLARRDFINETIKHLQDIDSSVDNQAFVMMIFGRTEKILRRNVHYAFAFGGKVLKLSHMTIHQKETFLTRLNNPNNSMK